MSQHETLLKVPPLEDGTHPPVVVTWEEYLSLVKQREDALALYRTAAGQVLEAKAVIRALMVPAQQEMPALVRALREKHPGLLEG